MNLWLIALGCLAGSGFIAYACARLGLVWPLTALSLLLAAIAIQLAIAARGQGGFHDLAAVVATGFTVMPALLGLGAGALLAGLHGHALSWRSLQGGIIALALAAALASVVLTLTL